MSISSPYNENYIIFSNLKKDEWISQLINPDSHFYILIKEEVEQLFYKTGNFLTNLNFDDLYNLSIQITIRQFNKNINKKKSWFLTICNENRIIYKKVKERLVNNCKNLFDEKRKINVLNLENHFKNQSQLIESHDSISVIEDLKKIAKIEPKKFKEQIKNLYFDLDIYELEYLCKIGDFNMIEVLEFDPRARGYDIKIDKNTNQSFFDFSEAV